MNHQRPLVSPSWILATGLALAILGLSAEPSQQTTASSELRSVPVVSNADSNGSMIAVTGMDITGSSILYLVDTERRQLAIYQATGGSSATSNVRLVGARNIDLDLRLDGYNDKSEFSYKELEGKFLADGWEPDELRTDDSR